jgi:ornithine cyclodeaminase/alanine dehydrogenase-like protein (mu-crystallin family)
VSGSAALPFLDADAVTALGPAAAVQAVLTALRGGLDPASGTPRSAFAVPAGELLLMPAATDTHVGVKLAGVAAGNAERGLPRISAVYVLFDAGTLQPVALLDGVALTTLRTPAVSVAAVRPWLRRTDRPLRTVVFGAGPQGLGHLRTLAALVPLAVADLVVRTPGRVPRPADLPEVRLLPAGSPEVEAALRVADVVVCATTARTPLFDSRLLPDSAVVIAVGSHEPDVAEVDAAWCGRATVVVEDVATALREAGDVVRAVAAGALDPAALVPMRDVATGRAGPTDGPVLFKGSGMAWQDLVVAEAVLAARSAQTVGRGPGGGGG